MHSIEYSYHNGIKEGFIQLLKQLLPLLPYKTLGEAIWAIELPLLDEDTAVRWILEYCHPTMVCNENIDTECPAIRYNHEEYDEEHADIKPGEVIVLVKQDFPYENGVYVYTGDGNPLLSNRGPTPYFKQP